MGIREEIDALESKVSKLRTDYEQYFARLIKREPLKLREEVERLILKCSNASITNTSFKFKYNSVVAKYSSYKQYWTRVLRAIEDGSYAVSKAAVASERAEAASEAWREAISSPLSPAPALGAPSTTLDTKGLNVVDAVPPGVALGAPSEEGLPQAEAGQGTKDGRLAEVYRLYIEAKSICNEPVTGIT
ncbi:MAG: hypothetical protein HZB83_01260, partial [Deltaproteobacteria bacterium]|nr:hypothetical protein [Deltaproteobacteria bacterium]